MSEERVLATRFNLSSLFVLLHANQISLTSGLKPEQFLLHSFSRIFHSFSAIRILLAGIVEGIAMFVWTSIAHMALRPGEAGGEIPNESAVVGAMQSSMVDKTAFTFSRTRVARYAAYRHSAG
jgi:hypothetical protein